MPEINVKAGQTIVLEIKTTGQSEAPGKGRFEVSLIYVNENTTAPQSKVYLVSENGSKTYEVDVEPDKLRPGYGTGEHNNIKAGKYTLSLEPPPPPPPPGNDSKPVKWNEAIYFGIGHYGISTSGALELEKIAKFLADEEQTNVKKVRCIGYADNSGNNKVVNMNLSIQRGAEARKILKEKLDANMLNTARPKPAIESTGEGQQLGDSDMERQENRRVEVWLTRETKLGATSSNVCNFKVEDFIVKDIHQVLGDSAGKHGAKAIPLNVVPASSVIPKEYQHYKAFLPSSKISDNGRFIMLDEDAINVYEVGSFNPHQPFDSSGRYFKDRNFEIFSFIAMLDHRLIKVTVERVAEHVNDVVLGDAGRIVYGYYQRINNDCSLDEEVKIEEYVIRRGIDLTEENKPKAALSEIQVVVAEKADTEVIRDNDLAEEMIKIELEKNILKTYYENNLSPDWYPKITKLNFVNKLDTNSTHAYKIAKQNIENIVNFEKLTGFEFQLGAPEYYGYNGAIVWFKPSFDVSLIPKEVESLIIKETNYENNAGQLQLTFKFDFKRSVWGSVWYKSKSGEWAKLDSLGRLIGSDDDSDDLDEYLPDLAFDVDKEFKVFTTSINEQYSSDSPGLPLDKNNTLPPVIGNDGQGGVVVDHDFVNDVEVVKVGAFVEWVEVSLVKRIATGSGPVYESIENYKKYICNSLQGGNYLFWHSITWLENKDGKWGRKTSIPSCNRIELGVIKVPETTEEMVQFEKDMLNGK